MHRIVYYMTPRGDSPFEAFLEGHFFFVEDSIVITHAFMKKTDKVPPEEIERALRYKKDFEDRFRRGEFDL